MGKYWRRRILGPTMDENGEQRQEIDSLYRSPNIIYIGMGIKFMKTI